MKQARTGGGKRHVKKEWSAKARNHPRVASALPHSEGIAYKPLCGEIVMCSRVRRMVTGSRQHNSDKSEDPWGGGLPHLQGGARSSAQLDAVRDY
jgi:hypothetical protein